MRAITPVHTLAQLETVLRRRVDAVTAELAEAESELSVLGSHFERDDAQTRIVSLAIERGELENARDAVHLARLHGLDALDPAMRTSITPFLVSA